MNKKRTGVKKMSTIAIYYSDLNERGRRKILSAGIYDANINIAPLAVAEFEGEDFLYNDDLMSDYVRLGREEFLERHSYLSDEDYEITDRIYRQRTGSHYYEVHIFFGRNEGYSRVFESEKYLEDEEDILTEAVRVMPDIGCDIEMCDYAVEVAEEEYKSFVGGRWNENEDKT